MDSSVTKTLVKLVLIQGQKHTLYHDRTAKATFDIDGDKAPDKEDVEWIRMWGHKVKVAEEETSPPPPSPPLELA
jgi:hypothetical protein